MKIVCLISSLGTGGAERVASILCNAWAQRQHDVHLVTYEVPGTPTYYPLDPAIKRHQLDLRRESKNSLEMVKASAYRVRRLRRTFADVAPDVVLSFITETNVLAIVALLGTRIPIVVTERTHLVLEQPGPLVSFLRRRTYPRADAVVAQHKDAAQWMHAHLRVDCDIIANPIDLDVFVDTPESGNAPHNGERKRITAVGRLSPDKGYDILFEAVARASSRLANWELVIYGEGPEREALNDLAERLTIADRVRMPGIDTDIPSRLHETDIFVLSSRFEGYPNSLMEALASGCCVVATNCSGGVREILDDGAYGTIVPPEEPDALGNAIAELANDEARRRDMAKRAPEAVASLGIKTVAEQWMVLFERVQKNEKKEAGFPPP